MKKRQSIFEHYWCLLYHVDSEWHEVTEKQQEIIFRKLGKKVSETTIHCVRNDYRGKVKIGFKKNRLKLKRTRPFANVRRKKNDDWVKQFIKKFTYFRFWGVINATIFVVAAERKVGTENRAFFKKPWTHGCYARSFMRRINLVKRIGTKPLTKCLMILQK